MSGQTKFFPTVNNPAKYERMSSVLDVKNTTLQGTLRNLLNDYYSKNVLKGVNGFHGTVLRKELSFNNFDYSPKNYTDLALGLAPVRYKVWIDGPLCQIYGSKRPSDDTPAGKTLINCLPDCTLSPQSFTDPIAGVEVGDQVWVTFDNTETYSNPVIAYKITQTPDGFGAYGSNIATSPSNAFDGVQFVPGTAEDEGTNPVLTDQEKALNYIIVDYPITFTGFPGIPASADVQAPNGTHNEAAYLATREGYNWRQCFSWTKKKMRLLGQGDHKLTARAAESCLALLKYYEETNQNSLNKKILLTSSYRLIETQVKLVRERFEFNPTKKILELNSDGLKQGYAGNPFKMRANSTGSHVKGQAIDIWMGNTMINGKVVDSRTLTHKQKFGTEVFKWMNENARRFNFFPTAVYIKSTPEAWHWEYIEPSRQSQVNQSLFGVDAIRNYALRSAGNPEK